MRNRDRTPPTTPYRPPAQDEQQLAEKVCPDCIADPDYHSEGGLRPVADFRVITGKGAERYAGGKRLAAYCRYHEAKRARDRRAAKKAAGEDVSFPDELRNRPRTPAVWRKWRRSRMARIQRDPQRLARFRARERERSRRYEAAHAEERRAYKAQWYQEKVRREVEAGKRPPPKYVYTRGEDGRLHRVAREDTDTQQTES